MDLKLYAAVAVVTFMVELPDKTAFASFILSTQKKPLAVFAGGAVAMVVHSMLAVAFGSVLALLPAPWVRAGSGCLFLGFAYFMWRRPREVEDPSGKVAPQGGFFSAVLASFVVIFAAEWGDLTQFSTATLAAKYNSPWTIFAAAVTGLWGAIGLAVWLGSKVGTMFKPATLRRTAAVVFLGVGLWMLLT